MSTTVLFFASLSDIVGSSEIALELDEAVTVTQLLDRLETEHPDLKRFERRYRVALNQEFVELDSLVTPGAEVALIPAVSGGAPPHVRAAISRTTLNIQSLTEEVMRSDCGAVVTFTGVVRDLTGEQVTDKLEYSAYEAMASKQLLEICNEAVERWSLGGAVVAHRIGELGPMEIAVVAACSSPHRKEAFEAARFLIDTTKERVPLWKKEFGPDGTAWIEGDARVDARGTPVSS